MKIDEIRIYGFDVPLLSPVVLGGQSVATRNGFIIQAVSSDGHSGFGEVSPLAGVHSETLKKARYDHDVCCRELKGQDLPDDAISLLVWCERFEPFFKSCSSTRFGLESALFSLAAARKGCCLATFLGYKGKEDVLCAGFLQGSVREVVDAGMRLNADGFGTVTLKVGGKNIPLEAQKVVELKRVLDPRVRIRINVNTAWALKEALLFVRGIGNDRIEFLEEPLTDYQEWHSFFQQTDIPIAADEHLHDLSELELAPAAGVKYMVIRPALLGGVSQVIRLLSLAREQGMRAVISSCFESGMGLKILANFAAMAGTDADIGSALWLKEDLLSLSLLVRGAVPFKALSFDTADLVPEFRRRLILS